MYLRRVICSLCLLLSASIETVWAQSASATGGPSGVFGAPGQPGMVADSVILSTVGIVADVEVTIDISHAFIGQLAVDLTHEDTATSVLLFSPPPLGGADTLLSCRFVDLARTQGPPWGGNECMQTSLGVGAMDAFDGEVWLGEWTLQLTDVDLLADSGMLNSWTLDIYDATQPAPQLPVSNVICQTLPTDEVEVSWDNNGTYDFITVEIVGLSPAVVVGSTTTVATIPVAAPISGGGFEVTVTSASATSLCANGSQSCQIALLPVADLVASNLPIPVAIFGGAGSPPSIESSTTVFSPAPIADLFVAVDIRHSFIGDMSISLSHAGITTILHAFNGGTSADDMRVTFWDSGPPYNTVPYDSGVMAPFRSLADDFVGLDRTGDWVLSIEDAFPASDSGELMEWSVGFVRDMIRGDVDNSGGVVALSDSIYLLSYGFASGSPPSCLRQADADGDGTISPLVDALYLLFFGFSGGPPPPTPGVVCGAAGAGLSCVFPNPAC